MSTQTEKFSPRAENSVMTPSADAVSLEIQETLHEMADAHAPREGLKQVFLWLSRQTGLTSGQVKRLWYAEWSVIPAHVFLAVRNAYRRNLERAAKQAEHRAATYRALSKEWDDLCENGYCANASIRSDGERKSQFVVQSHSNGSPTA